MGLRPIDDSDFGGRNNKNKKTTRKTNVKRASGQGKSSSGKKSKKNDQALGYAKTFMKVFGTTVGVFLLLIGILIFLSMTGWLGDVGKIRLQDLTIGTSSEVFYMDPVTGEETYMATITDGANRKWVDYEDIPKEMKDAFVAVEDERFYKH